MDKLDLTDPDVFRMAERNHTPHEEWFMGGGVNVNCDQCGQEWPCETTRAVRELHSRSGRRI